MRIAFVISTLARSGPVNVLFNQVSTLCKEHEIVVFTLAPEPIDSRIDEFNELGVKVVCVFKSRIGSILLGRHHFLRTLKKFHPDVVNLHGFRAYLLGAAVASATVATVHNRIEEDFCLTYGRIRGLLMTRFQVSALRKMDCIVACSTSNSRFLLEHYGLSSVTVRNGVDQKVFRPAPLESKMVLRERLGYSPDRIVFISTGGCSERKQTWKLVKVFKELCIEYPVELHILGGGPLLEECRITSRDVSPIVIHGPLDTTVPYLQAADFFISASSSEGMPLAVLEGLSCGLPALLSDIPPHREIYDLSEMNGSIRLFEEESSELAKVAMDILKTATDTPNFNHMEDLSSQQMAAAYEKVFIDVERSSLPR